MVFFLFNANLFDFFFSTPRVQFIRNSRVGSRYLQRLCAEERPYTAAADSVLRCLLIFSRGCVYRSQ